MSFSATSRTQFRSTSKQTKSQPNTSQASKQLEPWNKGKYVLASTPGTFKCFKCGQPGHKSPVCPKRKFVPLDNYIEHEEDENEDVEDIEEESDGEELDFL